MRRTVRTSLGVASALVIGLAVANCGDDSTSVDRPSYTATLSGANEKPNPITSPGTATATFVDMGDEIDWTLSFDGLTNVVQSHIHGPADATQNASVMINLFIPNTATGTPRPITVQGEITNANNANVSLDSLRTLFNNGHAYVNIHTSANLGGEIRGQVARSN